MTGYDRNNTSTRYGCNCGSSLPTPDRCQNNPYSPPGMPGTMRPPEIPGIPCIPECPIPPIPPIPPRPTAALACQMIPYSSGLVPVILAEAGLNVDNIIEDIKKIPIIGEEMASVAQKGLDALNKLLESLGLPPLEGKIECDINGNIGLGAWVPDIACNSDTGIIPPQAYSFTACQSGYICGLNASFANLAALNLSTKPAFITAHVETHPPSCAPKEEQKWTDVTPIDPNTGEKGIALKNQGDNAYCACGDGILPPGAAGNTYTTPGCRTVPFCKEQAKINCGDMVRVTFKVEPRDDTALEALLVIGFASAGLCIMPDRATGDECGCGCPCESKYPTPSCPTATCDCNPPRPPCVCAER